MFTRNLDVSAENGLIENMQFSLLVITVLIFAYSSFLFFRSSNKKMLSYCMVATLLPLVCAAREISFGRVWGLPATPVTLLKIFILLLAVSVVVSAILLFFKYSDGRYHDVIGLMTTPCSINIYAGVLIILVSSLFDNGHFFIEKNQLVEEALELFAFVMFARAALVVRPAGTDTRPAAHPAVRIHPLK